ncbi:hypothetical protein N7G274_003545 [Stereocaulon virgatum]|uniref:Uncharacterized protein n=1 Tax=Stereocaulon virgatum TaxID=373712 RepID=A0ABR4ADW3_9LECA
MPPVKESSNASTILVKITDETTGDDRLGAKKAAPNAASCPLAQMRRNLPFLPGNSCFFSQQEANAEKGSNNHED